MIFFVKAEDINIPKTPMLQIHGKFFSSSPVWNENNFNIWMDGFIYSRESEILLNEKDILELYKIYGNKICDRIKGIFILMICNEQTALFFTDHLGIKKLFFATINKNQYFSNNYWELSKNIDHKTVNSKGIALHALTNHFVNGHTIVNEIRFSKPASLIEINNNGITKISHYWALSKLLELPKQQTNIEDIGRFFLNLIKNYSTNKQNCSLTLTGGLDSRLILAALLKLGLKPNTFAYGNDFSEDVSIARAIAKKRSLSFLNFPPINLSADWFKNLSNMILERGNGLAHYHRAYRWDGISQVLKKENNKTVFAGFLGGEGIRGAHIDNLIITQFVQEWATNKSPEIIQKHLIQKFVNPNTVHIEEIIQELNELPYFTDNAKYNEFYLLFLLNASNHLAQDINFYIDNGIELILPFMDIDYLYMIFSSSFSMLNKDNTSKNQFNRLNIPDFHCRMIATLYPDLTKDILTNGYKPSEYLMGKLPYLFVRGIRKIFSKPNQSNFSYGSWFKEYLRNKQKNLSKNTDMFNYKSLAENLEEHEAISETQWHKFTSVYMINDLLQNSI